MSAFIEQEIEYLGSQRLGRVATGGSDGHPHVMPVSFRYSAEQDSIDIGGHAFATRKKYRDVLANPGVAFVVDDLASVNPWRPRGIELRGRAEVLGQGREALGPGFDAQMFRSRPRRIFSWGLDAAGPFRPMQGRGLAVSPLDLSGCGLGRAIPAIERRAVATGSYSLSCFHCI